jgi:hypothetical protein
LYHRIVGRRRFHLEVTVCNEAQPQAERAVREIIERVNAIYLSEA